MKIQICMPDDKTPAMVRECYAEMGRALDAGLEVVTEQGVLIAECYAEMGRALDAGLEVVTEPND